MFRNLAWRPRNTPFREGAPCGRSGCGLVALAGRLGGVSRVKTAVPRQTTVVKGRPVRPQRPQHGDFGRAGRCGRHLATWFMGGLQLAALRVDASDAADDVSQPCFGSAGSHFSRMEPRWGAPVALAGRRGGAGRHLAAWFMPGFHACGLRADAPDAADGVCVAALVAHCAQLPRSRRSMSCEDLREIVRSVRCVQAAFRTVFRRPPVISTAANQSTRILPTLGTGDPRWSTP